MKRILLTGLAAFPVILVILVMALGSCGLDLETDDDTIEYSDWVMSKPDANGNRTLTLYLGDTDGVEKVGVPVKRSERAVGIELAHMSHDYFEAIFAAATPKTVARSTWELGQNAGIRGVFRDTTGVDYSAYSPASAFSSTVFVGRKSDKTLLAVGYLSHVDDVAASASNRVTTATRSVTFTVIPVTNNVTLSKTNLQATASSSFWTTTGATSLVSGTATKEFGTAANASAETYTTGRFSALGGVEYPLFDLPEVEGDGVTNNLIHALYRFTYPFVGTTGNPGPAGSYPDYRNMSEAVRVINDPTAGIVPSIIKRDARFLDSGQLMYAETAERDVYTKVSFPTGVFPAGATTGQIFSPNLNIDILSEIRSNKTIFSIVFEVPVYAITRDASTNGANPYEKWYIRPGFGVPLYNLDNGSGAGGCVLLGTGVSALDWIDIKIVGVGLNQGSGIIPNP